jgi:hypothetical protein
MASLPVAEVEKNRVPAKRRRRDRHRTLDWIGYVLRDPVDGLDHGAVRNGEHIRAEGTVAFILQRIASKRPAIVVQPHPVDGKSLRDLRCPGECQERPTMVHSVVWPVSGKSVIALERRTEDAWLAR